MKFYSKISVKLKSKTFADLKDWILRDAMFQENFFLI